MERVARIAIRVALAAAILAFVPGLLEPFQPIKTLVLRAIGLSLLVWVGIEAWFGRVPRPGALTLSVLGWCAAAVLATVFSLSPHLSLLGEVTQREGLLTLLGLAGLYLGSVQSHEVERDVRDTLQVIVVCSFAAATYAQLQLAGLDPIAWSGVHTYAVNGAIALRPAGPLGNPILLGIVLAAALPIVLARLSEPTSESAWLVPAAALVAASLMTTLSRGAWFAAAAGVGVMIILRLSTGAPAKRVGWTLAASLSPALLFGLARSYAPVVARLTEGWEGQSAVTRASLARGALQLWSQRPWFGVGPDGFGLAYPRIQEPAFWRAEWIGIPVHAHTVPLQLLATIGVVGALAGVAWLVSAAWALWRGWREVPAARAVLSALAGVFAALLAAGSVNVVGPAGAALFAVCTGLVGAVRERRVAKGVASRPMPRAVPALGSAVVCWAVLSAGVPEFGALSLAPPARENLRPAGATPGELRARATANARALQRAVSVWPHDDLLWRLACETSLAQAAVVNAADEDIAIEAEAVAEACARRAAALEPRRAENLGCLGDALAARALRTASAALADSADSAYERASELAPANGWLLVARARLHLARRDGVRALEIAQHLTGLYPEAAVGHTLSGTALMLLHRPGEARAELANALASRWEQDAGAQRAAVERLLASVNRAQSEAQGAARGSRRLPRR